MNQIKERTLIKRMTPFLLFTVLTEFRALRIQNEKFVIPYKDRFKEGEYKNRVQFMYGGELQQVEFKYYGPSVEAVLDKLPMQK